MREHDYVAKRIDALLAPYTALFHGKATIFDTPALRGALADLLIELNNESVQDASRERDGAKQ